MRTLKAIRAHTICQKLSDEALAGLADGLRCGCLTETTKLPELAGLTLTERFDLTEMLRERVGRDALLESIEMEQCHRSQSRDKAPI